MQTVSVQVMNLCVPCACRCRYCLLSYCGQVSKVDYKRSEAYAKRFYDWLRENRPELSFVFGFGYSMEHPKLLEAVDFLQSIGSPTGSFLQFNGMAFRDDAELVALLRELKQRDIKLLELTFYGEKVYHDRFSARPDDFDYLLRILAAANQLGLPVNVGIALTAENADGIGALLNILSTHQIAHLYCFVPHSEGRGAALEESRFDERALHRLAPKAAALLNLEKFRTERAWATCKEMPEPTKRLVALTLREDNIEQFEQMPFDKTIAYLEGLDDTYYRQMPSFERLIESYAQGSGKFYSLRDLTMIYERRYIKEHGLQIYDVNDETQCFSRRY